MSNIPNLGKLSKVDLRKAWNNEAYDFTNWLALDENLSLLSDEIGIELKLIQTEANVGKFNVDMLAEEENTGHKIIIENQLEDTDHDHLGKIITYASGFDAKIIIWIVEDVREEHKQAIDWLNEHTDEDINFFAIKMELWQIGGSPFAPKFQIICQPNNWAKAVKSSGGSRELTNTKLMQLDFWDKLKEYIQTNDSKIRLQTPRPQHWYDFSMGSSEAHIALTVNSKDNGLGCEIYISHNKELFHWLEKNKEGIEQELGEKAIWIDAAVASRIKVSREVKSLFDDKEYQDYFNWFHSKVLLFQKVFSKYIKDFRKVDKN